MKEDTCVEWEAEKAACKGISLEEWMQCKRKIRYGRKATAEKAAEHMKRKHGSILEAYECGYCDGWHIGHRSGWRTLFNVIRGKRK